MTNVTPYYRGNAFVFMAGKVSRPSPQAFGRVDNE